MVEDDRSYQDYDPQSGRQETFRINPETGARETLVQGAIGSYWQDNSRVIRDKWGIIIDLEG